MTLVSKMAFSSSNSLVPRAKKYIYICMFSCFDEVLMGTSSKPNIFSKHQCKFHRDWLRNNRALSFQRYRQTDQPIVQRDANSSGFQQIIRRQAIVQSNCFCKILSKDPYAKVLMQSTLLSTLPPISPISRPPQL